MGKGSSPSHESRHEKEKYFSHCLDSPFCCSSANGARVDLGGESQGAQGLAKVAQQWRNVDKHQCLAIASKRVLEQVREFRVAVRDVCILVGDRIDDVAEARQTLVDRLCFPKSVSCRAGL